MRPLRLDIAGFAAFRDPVTVDFTDADYFALTGSTGSGKSTVIDAMTFALYGSAPRWGRENAIQYALAPTANRCTVRLVFDLADQRYVVAREVRRSGKQIAQRNPRLERYLDPAATGDPGADEPTESLAADARSIRAQVVELLGLDFEDFCTCVVLPQGDFATFLKASVADRQAILLKLLGARHYETIGRMANRRATEAAARTDALQQQLAGYGDATEAAETTARDHEQWLAALVSTVTAEVAELTGLLTDRAGRADRMTALETEVEQLAAVHAPAGIAALQRSLTAADEAYASSARAEREAAAALDLAEEALRSGPHRAALEETLRRHTERSEASARAPELGTAATQAQAALDDAQRRAAAAAQTEQQARDDHERRRLALEQASSAVDAAERQLALLERVVVPDQTADLDRAAARARGAVTQAAESLEVARGAAAQAAATVADLPERSALIGLQRSVAGYADVLAQLRDRRSQWQATLDESQQADRTAAGTAEAVELARTEVERLRTQEAAADLRPQLSIGHSCPVCDQPVTTLPAPLRAPGLESGRSALHEAEAAHRVAADAAGTLRTRLTGLAAQTEALERQLGGLDQILTSELPTEPGAARDPDRDAAAVAELLARLDQAKAAQQQELRQQELAQRATRAAEQERDRSAEEARNGWAVVHATAGQLSALGAPAVTAAGLADAWAQLVAWSTSRATTLRSVELAAAQDARSSADAELAAAAERLREATSLARAATADATAAAVAASRARTESDDVAGRLTELTALLADQPSEADATRLLAEHRRLDQAAGQARAGAQAAFRARRDAEVVRDRQRAERDTARAALHQVREPLVALGMPGVDDTDLARAWTDVVDWAAGRAAARRTETEALHAWLAAADADLVGRLARLAETLSGDGLDGLGTAVPVFDDLITTGGIVRLQRIPTEVELAWERARANTATIVRRRADAARLRQTIAADTEIEQVSRQLGQLLSARRFPQWLADAALDTLVADASASLLELSGRQFELTHTGGEFFVIDHADADSLRSVKTLSGGETFQASLALALALSEQLSTLAAGGRTTLDSIFLDEGFGTLDPDALEIVAATLESLAQGNRMVGIVTHVAALAERVPVRFEVSRDSRTSTIERVGA